MLNREKMTISLTADETGYKMFLEKAHVFIDAIAPKQTTTLPKVELPVVEHGIQEGFKSASQVQYVARSGNFLQHGYSYHGALHILKVILGYDYLWNNVRVKGGAYGCMCGFSQSGNAYFVSYRDPNLNETNEIYEQAYEYVKNFTVTERDMTKYMIGAISNMDTPMNPSAIGSRSFNAYMMGITEEQMQTIRNQVLEVTQQDIRDLAPLIKAFMDDGNICVIGNDKKIEECKDLFEHIENLL